MDNDVQVLTIPFESFVLDPWPYLKKIEDLLGSKMTSKIKRIIKKQNVPRKKLVTKSHLRFTNDVDGNHQIPVSLKRKS
jgi:hypothetical protein